MNYQWKVHTNEEGDFVIAGREDYQVTDNLFGLQRSELALRIHAHELLSLRGLLQEYFPNVNARSLEAMEECIREEFCENRSLSEFKYWLDNAQIPYRIYNRVA